MKTNDYRRETRSRLGEGFVVDRKSESVGLIDTVPDSRPVNSKQYSVVLFLRFMTREVVVTS